MDYPAAYAAASALVDEARAAFATVGPTPAAGANPASFFAASHRPSGKAAGGDTTAAAAAGAKEGEGPASSPRPSGSPRSAAGAGGREPQPRRATIIPPGVHQPPVDPFADVSGGRSGRSGRPGSAGSAGRGRPQTGQSRASASPSVSRAGRRSCCVLALPPQDPRALLPASCRAARARPATRAGASAPPYRSPLPAARAAPAPS